MVKRIGKILAFSTFAFWASDTLAAAFWFYQHNPYVPSFWWTIPEVSSSVYVEQSQAPVGYGYRIHAPGRLPQNIRISVEGGFLVVRSPAGQQLIHPGIGGPVVTKQFGGSVQWFMLPADANVQAMQLGARNGVLEVFVPKR